MFTFAENSSPYDSRRVHTDAELDGLQDRLRPGIVSNPLLDRHRAVHRIHRTGELDKGAVPHHLDDTAPELSEGRVKMIGPNILQRSHGARFIRTD